MAAKYAKIDGVGSLDGILNKFFLFKLSEIFTVLLWNINSLNCVKKSKKYFLVKISKNNNNNKKKKQIQFIIEIA